MGPGQPELEGSQPASGMGLGGAVRSLPTQPFYPTQPFRGAGYGTVLGWAESGSAHHLEKHLVLWHSPLPCALSSAWEQEVFRGE